ncbi:MAG: sulfite exporter TauE/SafE family protein [Cyclobacteriaceae bacterium]|nr:sulfite exporter TauE/SafE family protein [Cyclobacteriaceae bacterium]MCX7636758.1 sulfite exporter TauE/SafE family protein [Cyclobacteriaceae bacterium]MDW8330653.1 sulfite exporter TauE/SafE family protein [Cyclobacteriaceae bacterium]
MTEIVGLSIAGLIGGFIAGLTGIGTGFMMLAVIPLVLHHYQVPAELFVPVTIANTVLATLVSSGANLITTLRTRTFYQRETAWTSFGAVVSSFIVFELVAKSEFYSRKLFTAVIIVFMLIIIFQTFQKLRLSNPEKEKVNKKRLVVTGVVAGTASALTGLGGGTLLIPMLNLWQKMDILKAKSISFGTIFSIALWLSINNLFLEPDYNIPGSKGLIVFPLVIPISLGVVIGSPAGVMFSHRIPSRTVTLLFLIVLSVVTIQKAFELINL